MEDVKSHFIILICYLMMNSTSNGTTHHVSHLFITFWGVWSAIQDNSEKAILYALIGIFIGLLGVLILVNITLCKKLENAHKKHRNVISDLDGPSRKKPCEKSSSPDKPYVMQRAPSGGWTFHEECSKPPCTPQSFASSPLLPAWDVYVHVDSPHESPALVSMSKQHLERNDLCLHTQASYQLQSGSNFMTSQKQVFISKSLPHRLFANNKQVQIDSMKPAINNNNDEENNIWVRRSCLKLENNHFPMLPSQLDPSIQRLSLTEV